LSQNNNVERLADNFDFIFYVGSEHYNTYNDVTNAQNGITSGQIKPIFTNIMNNGIIEHNCAGLFTTRYTKTIINVGIGQPTIDSIACGQYTKHLNFLNSANQNFCN